jgi:hypothetical protein
VKTLTIMKENKSVKIDHIRVVFAFNSTKNRIL